MARAMQAGEQAHGDAEPAAPTESPTPAAHTGTEPERASVFDLKLANLKPSDPFIWLHLG